MSPAPTCKGEALPTTGYASRRPEPQSAHCGALQLSLLLPIRIPLPLQFAYMIGGSHEDCSDRIGLTHRFICWKRVLIATSGIIIFIRRPRGARAPRQYGTAGGPTSLSGTGPSKFGGRILGSPHAVRQ